MTIQAYEIAGRTAREIAESVESAIREGRLEQDARLPSIRRLAGDVAVSPGTVAAAYGILKARGLARGEGRRGTRVTPRPPLPVRVSTPVPGHVRDLATGNPAPALLPGLETALRRVSVGQRLYGERPNLPELLAAAREQFDDDAIPSSWLAVVGGALDGIERVLQAHLLPGDRVALEDPGFPPVTDLVRALGLVPEPVRVDDAGPVPEDLRRALRAGAAACIVTTRAQNPTGAALTEHRAGELRMVLDGFPETLVVEDDHAGPVSGAHALTLCHRSRPRWAVVRSVSKSLGPDLRLAIMAGDASTVARVEGRQLLGTGWVSHVLQRVVATLWADPGVQGLMRRAADAYALRRRTLIDALARQGIGAHGRSGLNVWILVSEEMETVRALLEAGWAVSSGERYRIRTPPAIRVTVSTLRPDEAERLAVDLARVLRPERRVRSA